MRGGGTFLAEAEEGRRRRRRRKGGLGIGDDGERRSGRRGRGRVDVVGGRAFAADDCAPYESGWSQPAEVGGMEWEGVVESGSVWREGGMSC